MLPMIQRCNASTLRDSTDWRVPDRKVLTRKLQIHLDCISRHQSPICLCKNHRASASDLKKWKKPTTADRCILSLSASVVNLLDACDGNCDGVWPSEKGTANVQTYQFHRSAGKIAILRKHFVESVPVSDVCKKHGSSVVNFYNWKKSSSRESQKSRTSVARKLRL
jgi:hypothetical protein